MRVIPLYQEGCSEGTPTEDFISIVRDKRRGVSEVVSCKTRQIFIIYLYYTPQPFALRFLKDRLPLLIEGNYRTRAG